MKIHDISLLIEEGMLKYPSDPTIRFTPFKVQPGDSSNLTDLSLGTHTGTHFDAPRHFFRSGLTIDKLSLDKLVGWCRVIDLTSIGDNISKTHLRSAKIKKGERLLFKTSNGELYKKKRFDTGFVGLDSSAAELFVQKEVRLVGIDYFSVEPYKTEGAPTHRALLKSGTAVIEGLDLREVKAGNYFLAALPLKLKGLDGAPGRVVLIEGLK